MKSINLKNLIYEVIKLFFSKSKFNSVGKLEWFPPSEKEIKKTFEKSGVKVSQQRHQCFKTDEFKINSTKEDKKTNTIDQMYNTNYLYCKFLHR